MKNQKLKIFFLTTFFLIIQSFSFSKNVDFIFDFGANLYLNPESSSLNSAPSPVNFEFSFGALIPNETFISVQPSLTFFSMNYLWYEDRALPAEIESRTGTALSFFFNVPLTFTLNLANSKLLFSAGGGALMRFAFLSSGVSSEDFGYSGSAKSDIENMNSWFWQKARWFYSTLEFSWLYNVTQKLKAGPNVSIKLPLGSMISDHSFSAAIFSAGIKITL